MLRFLLDDRDRFLTLPIVPCTATWCQPKVPEMRLLLPVEGLPVRCTLNRLVRVFSVGLVLCFAGRLLPCCSPFRTATHQGVGQLDWLRVGFCQSQPSSVVARGVNPVGSFYVVCDRLTKIVGRTQDWEGVWLRQQPRF